MKSEFLLVILYKMKDEFNLGWRLNKLVQFPGHRLFEKLQNFHSWIRIKLVEHEESIYRDLCLNFFTNFTTYKNSPETN